MADDAVLRQVRLGPAHSPSGRGRDFLGSDMMPAPSSLAIVRYDAVEGLYPDGFYLLYLDDRGEEIRDTWHDSLHAALAHATWEFNVLPQEWEVASESSAILE